MDYNEVFWLGFFTAAAIYGFASLATSRIVRKYELKKEYQKAFNHSPPNYFSIHDLREAMKIYETSHR